MMSPHDQTVCEIVALCVGALLWRLHSLPKAGAEDHAKFARMFESAGVPGKIDWNKEEGAFVFQHAGRDYRLRFDDEGSSLKYAKCLKTAIGFQGTFSLSRKGVAERFLSTTGLAKAVSSGDARFDDEFMIESEPPDFAPRYLADDERRRAIHELFGLGYKSVDMSGGVLSLCWTPLSDGSTGEDGPLLRSGLESMQSLSRIGADHV